MILLKVLGLGSLFIAGLLGVFGVCLIACLIVNASLGKKAIKIIEGEEN